MLEYSVVIDKRKRRNCLIYFLNFCVFTTLGLLHMVNFSWKNRKIV